MAAKKKDETTGLYGYPITVFHNPATGDVVEVSNAITEHNLRAAGYTPKDAKAVLTDEEKLELAEEHPLPGPAPATPSTTTQNSR